MACLRTYVGLTIHSPDIAPDKLSSLLNAEPARCYKRDPAHKYYPNRIQNFWSFSTQYRVDSTNYAVHLKEIFRVFKGREGVLKELRDSGCETRISVYWEADGRGQDSIFLDSEAIGNLNHFGLEIWWDIYTYDSDEEDDT